MVVETGVAMCECESLERRSPVYVFTLINMLFSLKILACTHVAKGGVNLALDDWVASLLP